MQSSAVGLIFVCLLVLGAVPKGEAQFLAKLLGVPQAQNQQGLFRPLQAQPQPQQAIPQQGSVSTADSEAYSRDVQLGRLVGLQGGVTKSQSITQDESGATNAARSTSVTKGLNIGKLDLSSTLTGSKTVNNGQVSRSLSDNINIGKLNIDSSLSKDNLKKGLGVHRSEDGGLELGLGLLNIDLSKNKQQPTAGQTGTNAQVQAVGTGANVNSISNTNSQTQQLGKLSSTTTHSKSSTIGSVLKGLTSGQAGGFAGGGASNAASGNFRRRRVVRQADFLFPDAFQSYGQGFGLQDPYRSRRQPQRGRQPAPQLFNNNANAQGLANNQNALFQQQAGANTLSHNEVNKLGQFQDNTGSSIASNLANDGSSGQLSSANFGQQNFQTADGSGTKNDAQSQSLNFGKDSTQATSSNADTTRTVNGNSEKIDTSSGATANQQTQFGSSTNTAQTNTQNFNDGNQRGSLSNANSQSTFQGANGGAGGALAGTNSQSVIGPNGQVTNSASSQASSFSNNGGPASASASASSGTGPNGSFTNAQGLASTNLGGGFAGGRRGHRWKKGIPQPNVEPRTFDTIFNLLQGLFSDPTVCNQCAFYVPSYQKNCCPQCCNFPPQPLPQPLPRPPPPAPPLLPPVPPSVQITSAVFTPWFYQRPCCPTCPPQIGAFPCGRGIGRPPFPPPYYYYG